MELTDDALREEIMRLRAHLLEIESWEADLIIDNDAWQGSLPCWTQGGYDTWMKLQVERNRLLGRGSRD